MQRRKVCRYFERGSCKKQKCPFVHIRQSKKNCEFHMKGLCKKGQNCNFYHPPKQTQQQRQIKKKFKPEVFKKEKQHQYQQHIQQDKQEETNEEKIQNKEEIQQVEIQENKQQKMEQLEKKNKENRIRMILGLAQSSSEDYSEPEDIIEPQKKLKPLNFHKIYPKKFPDYGKSAETKKSIQENQQKYFKGRKFIDFLKDINDPHEKQYYQIIRKFQDSFKLEEDFGEEVIEHQPRFYRIRLRPLLFQTQIKLHFQMIQDTIQIQIDCRKYPEQRAKFKIMNYSIPQPFRIKLESSLDKMHQKKSIFETLKTFMNNFQKIYEQAKSKLQNEYFSQIELQKKIQKTLQREAEQKINKKIKKPKKIKKQQAQNENPDVQIEKYAPQEKIVVGNMNYDIIVQSLMINNCEYVLAQRVLLFLECICDKAIIHILEADRKEMKIGVKLKCKKCNIIIRIALQREVMQLRSTIIGKLGIENARLMQIGGISWKAGCSCDQDILKDKLYRPGQRLNANCHLCFKHLSIHYMGLKIFNPFNEFNITENKELPNKGSCKHMKLSFRWVRYGCCGRMFSCDDCHQNGSIHAHEKIEGITMLCGFCSIEQPVGKQCIHCKRQLARGVDKNGHWQGGMGCRDQTLLSKKDAKKYSGLTKKK